MNKEKQEDIFNLLELLGIKWVERGDLHIDKSRYYFNGAYLEKGSLLDKSLKETKP